ncbi:small ribosomal subunit protein mS35 isoform X2 [Oryctolagus cuniculus]|uniref:small ribosomal subunit protein mS35 isoform X2 n=1 Tax=Oryctolagus cuniculus TaxID=9986 RepID=UPI0007EE6A56|nr:28S ribosomal protein S35, mitochondrial isoform X1 [Oryctolagus cuniculus]
MSEAGGEACPSSGRERAVAFPLPFCSVRGLGLLGGARPRWGSVLPTWSSHALASLLWKHLTDAPRHDVFPAPRASPNPDTTQRTSRSQRAQRRKALPPRTEKMAVDQDWPSVYPVAAPFKPSVVPLPVRMGYPVKKGVPMAKEGNLELLKIPNFLHLTPVAIKKHCEVLKDFCTEWPAALDTDEKCEKHFPIEIDTAAYVSSGPSIRNPKARTVTLRVKLSSLNLDDHAKKKLIKLAGERYCKTSDVLTIRTDRCPLKRQNYDYAIYLLTVLYHESWKTEEWEKYKSEADMEEYEWKNSSSEKNILDTLLQMRAAEKTSASGEELLATKEVDDYRRSVVSLKNEGDSEKTLSQYKESVKRLLNLT